LMRHPVCVFLDSCFRRNDNYNIRNLRFAAIAISCPEFEENPSENICSGFLD
jgi:hypothetical protein